MRFWKYEIATHWKDSIATDFITEYIKLGVIVVDADILLKAGGLLVIVSNINKVKQRNRGVQEAGLGDASSDDAGTNIRGSYV